MRTEVLLTLVLLSPPLGVTLWDIEAVRKDLDVHPKPNMEINITASDSLHEKSSLLDVSASLKASFLGGLVEVGGSARYLNDTVSSTQQCRVTMQYKQTTEFKQLTMTHLGKVSYPEVFEKKTATHVITAVLYGAQAFLVFNQTASKNESKQDIQGNLHVMVKKIPLFSIEGEGALKMTEEDKKKVQEFSCKFYGDFQLKQNPTTYLEAVQVYSKLPELLGEKGEKAVPVRVWLYPLIDLDSNAARLVREISVSLVSEAEKVLEQLAEAYVRSNSLISNNLVSHFTDLKNKLEDFQGKFEPYKEIFQKALSRILPAIRGGGKEEQALVDILQVHHKSPLTHKQMEEWLDDKDDEIQVLRSYTVTMKSIPIVSTAELQGVLFDPQIDSVFCFAFTSLKYKDQYLSTLTQYLQSEEFRKLETSGSVLNYLKEEPQPWFKSPELSASMRVNLQLFTEFSKANMDEERTKFVITSISDPSNPGASIRLYRRGKLEDPQFKPVSKPPPLDLTDIQYSCHLTVDPKTPHVYVFLSEGNRKMTHTRKNQPYGDPDHGERFDWWGQALCRESLSGSRYYWEVEWSIEASVAVTYKGIGRKGSGLECGFGCNDQSWLLDLKHSCYKHKNEYIKITAPITRRIGVYLDHSAGILSFYSISDTLNTMTLLHTVKTTFTEPLYPGLGVHNLGTVSLCKLG
ncbi:STXB protein, partial [Amia calva]|nr:STXB protein [Amia calva]